MRYYSELLKICGFENDEIEKESSRIEKSFRKLGLGPEDMPRAEKWVKVNHDVTLLGVRKLLGAWLKELIDLVLAKEEGKKVVYYGFPTIAGPGMSIRAAAPEAVYSGCPDVILCHTMGQIFNKLSPILKAGEENGLPPGHGLCSLQTIRAGALASGIIPVPDLALTSSYYCDAGSKTDELLHYRYGHPAIYVDGSMDSRWGEYPEYSPERVKFLGAELNGLFSGVKDILGIEVTNEAWDQAMAASRHLFSGISRSNKLINTDPVPISQAEVGLATWLATGCTGRAMKEGPLAIDILNQEIEERVAQGIGVVEKGAPRVMMILTNYSDASVIHMIEEEGLAVCATLFSSAPPKGKAKDLYDMRGERIADNEMRIGFFHSTYGKVQRTVKAIEDSNIDGIIWNYLYNCRPLSLTSHLLKKWVEENLGIPTLALETDNFDTRSYSAAALRTRIETFADILRAKRALGDD